VLVKVVVRAELVTPSDWLPKVKVLGDRLPTAAVPTPVPVRARDCGLSGALSVMVTVPVRFPAEPGVKVTLIVQVPPTAKVLPQVFAVTAKSVASVPVTPMLVTVSVALPSLVRVVDCTPLVVPRFSFPNARVLGLRLTVGLVPLPVKAID